MSEKNVDKYQRWRSVTVGFRVSSEESEQINVAVALSGLSKQEYCCRRCLNRDIVVQGNPMVYLALRNELAAVLAELRRIECGGAVREELLLLFSTQQNRTTGAPPRFWICPPAKPVEKGHPWGAPPKGVALLWVEE